MKKHISVTLDQIPRLAKETAKKLKGGEVLALIGPLGSGKTTFTQALGKQLKVKSHITSPTFIVMNRYPARVGGKKLHLYHLDLYRTKNYREIKALGLEEFWKHPETVTVIEWADKMRKHLPKNTIYIDFKSPE